MGEFDKAIRIIMSEPPELHYASYYADLLRSAVIPDTNEGDTISREAALDCVTYDVESTIERINGLPSALPERLTDDDFETIRIHLTAIKEELCNQHRWKEAEDYERLINRFMSFASSQTASNQLVYHQDNVTDFRSKFVSIVVKHFKYAGVFLDYIEDEKYTCDFDCFYSADGECYIIDRNTGEYVNWYKFTHIGRDIHTNMTVEQLDVFIERFSKAEC